MPTFLDVYRTIACNVSRLSITNPPLAIGEDGHVKSIGLWGRLIQHLKGHNTPGLVEKRNVKVMAHFQRALEEDYVGKPKNLEKALSEFNTLKKHLNDENISLRTRHVKTLLQNIGLDTTTDTRDHDISYSARNSINNDPN